MRLVIVGASGNIGTSVLEAPQSEDGVTSILGRAPTSREMVPEDDVGSRRRAERRPRSTLPGADVVVHLRLASVPIF
jgi:hypothetical protein